MAYSYNEVTATGSAQLIAAPPYIDQSHIKVSINSVDTTSFTWANDSTVSVTATAGAIVRVRRESSPSSRVVDYMDGMSLTEVVLDNDSKQAFFLSQEQLDSTAEAVGAIGGLAAALSAVTVGAATATTKASEASTSASAASTASTTSATKASEASTSAATASTASTTAATKAGEASTSASTASTAATTATTKAGEASASAANAATSATNAATSAASAATSATTAANAAASVVSQMPGEVCYFARNTPPSGFLKANGATVSRTTYAPLFAAIGTTFGVGDGSTTFTLPDLRGEFLRGWDDARGIDSGRVFGGSQTDAFQGHWHNVTRNSSFTPGGGTHHAIGGSGTNNVASANDAVREALSDGVNGTPRTASETRPRNIALLACIKY